MTGAEHSIGRATALRDAAVARIRKTTTTVVALAAGLTALFTAVAASSTHARQHVARPPQARRAPRVTAPAPALVPVAGRQTDRRATPAPTSTATPQPAPAPTPAPVTAPPVVSSGGS